MSELNGFNLFLNFFLIEGWIHHSIGMGFNPFLKNDI